MRKKLVLLSLIAFSSLSFASDSVYAVKTGMLSCYEKSVARDGFIAVISIGSPKSKKFAQKLIDSKKCILLLPNDQFIILDKYTKGRGGAYIDYLKIRKIKDNNKDKQKQIDKLFKHASVQEKKAMEQLLTGWVYDLRTSSESTMYRKVK